MHFGKTPGVWLDLRLLSKSHRRFPVVALSILPVTWGTGTRRPQPAPPPQAKPPPLESPQNAAFWSSSALSPKTNPGVASTASGPGLTAQGVRQPPHSLPAPGVLHPAADWGDEGAVPWEGSSSPALPPASPGRTLRQLLLLPRPPEALGCYRDGGWNPDGYHLSHLPGDSWGPPRVAHHSPVPAGHQGAEQGRVGHVPSGHAHGAMEEGLHVPGWDLSPSPAAASSWPGSSMGAPAASNRGRGAGLQGRAGRKHELQAGAPPCAQRNRKGQPRLTRKQGVREISALFLDVFPHTPALLRWGGAVQWVQAAAGHHGSASAALGLLWGSLPHQELCIPGEHSLGKHLPTLAPTLDLIALRLQLVLLSSLLVLAHLSLSSPRAADLSL